MRTILIFLMILGSCLQLRNYLYAPDAPSYYAVAKSLSFDRDLMFNNELRPGWENPVTISPTYHIVESHQIGASLVWMLITDPLKIIGIAKEDNLEIVINFTEYLLGILALIFIYKICLKFFDSRTAFWSILAVLLGTNLWAYITIFTGASHVSDLFFTSGFLLFYLNTYKQRSKIDWLILGGLAGLMLMARGDSALYLIFPAVDLFRYIKNKDLKTVLFFTFVFILGLLFTFSPQLLFWKIIFGKIIRFYGEPGLFTGNKFLEVLFHPSQGFLFFSPFLGLCFFVGLFYFYKKEKMLAISSALIFLALVYGIGKAKFSWNGGCFGARFFLVLMPLFILSVAACFERLSLKNRVVLTVISGMWSFLLFLLFIRYAYWHSYKFIIAALNPIFFTEVFQNMHNFFNRIIDEFAFLKFIFLITVLLAGFLTSKVLKKIIIPKIALKRISIYLVGGIIIYIHMIFLQCYFNDQKVITRLKKEGFYQNAVFGEFDKGGLAELYLGYAEEAIRSGIGLAIETVKRAMRLYPPYQEDSFEELYKIYTDSPTSFNTEFLKRADAFDCLGLSLKFYEKRNFAKAKYYFQEALRLKPDILKVAKEKRDHYLSNRLNKARDFYVK